MQLTHKKMKELQMLLQHWMVDTAGKTGVRLLEEENLAVWTAMWLR